MTLNRSLLLLIVAIVCFVIALLIAINTFSGNYFAWVAGGLLASVASRLP